jgi:excisionase family DNA binding protein
MADTTRNNGDELLTFGEAAQLLRCGESTLRGRYRIWGLPRARIGRRVLFPRAALDSWVAAQTETLQ